MNFYSICKEYRQLVKPSWTYMWTILHCDGVSHNSGTIFPGLVQFIILPSSHFHLGTCYWTILHGGSVSCQLWHMSFPFKFWVFDRQKIILIFSSWNRLFRPSLMIQKTFCRKCEMSSFIYAYIVILYRFYAMSFLIFTKIYCFNLYLYLSANKVLLHLTFYT